MIIYFLIFSLSYGGSIPNSKCPDGVYQGSSCDSYFRCTNGQQTHELFCPTGKLFNSATGACDRPDRVTCPKEDYEGILNDILLTDQHHVDCAKKLRNGSIEFINEGKSVSIDGVCGGYGICHNGTVEINYCPGNIYYGNTYYYDAWNPESKMCESEYYYPGIIPCNRTEFEWEMSAKWNLTDCIGFDGENCRIQFVTQQRAKTYCEKNADCVGVNEQPCTYLGYGKNITCVGTRWIPYKTLIEDRTSHNQHVLNRILPCESTNTAPCEEQLEKNLDFDWSDRVGASWDHCADYKYLSDGNCYYSFKTEAEAKKYCEQLELVDGLICDGVTTQNDGDYSGVSFIAIAGINLDTKQKASEISLKQRRFWKSTQSKNTEEGKLTELWSQEIAGFLSGCAGKIASKNREAKCELIDNLFEAKYYCESLGDMCGGVTLEDNGYTVRTGTSIMTKSGSKSWLKGPVEK